MKIAIILASVREGRRGEGFARWVQSLAAQKAEAEIVDLRDFPLGAYRFKDGTAVAEKSYAEGSLEKRWSEKIASFDAFIVVTPEYSHSFPGHLKNAIDHAYAGWNYKPIAFVSYGGFSGGTRAVEQLRLVAIEQRMVPIRDEVNLRLVGIQLDEKGAPKDELYARRAAAMLDELAKWGEITSRFASSSRRG